MMAERSTALSTEFLTIIHRGGYKNIAFFSYSRQMKALFPLLLSSLLLFSCGTDEPQRPKDALHAAADAYPLITETRESYVIPISWRIPLIPRQLLTEMSDATRWLKLPPTEKNTVSFDVWIEGEQVNPHQRQKAAFAKEFYEATGTELNTTPLLCGVKALNVYGVTEEGSVSINRNVRLHLPTFMKVAPDFEYEGVGGYHMMCGDESSSHEGDLTVEQANDRALGELRPALRFHLPKDVALRYKYLKIEFQLINDKQLEAQIAPSLLF